MANRDIAGLLTGIPSGGIDPRTQMSGRDMLVQSALAGQQRMAGGLRGMFNGKPTIQQQLVTAAGEKQRADEAKRLRQLENLANALPAEYASLARAVKGDVEGAVKEAVEVLGREKKTPTKVDKKIVNLVNTKTDKIVKYSSNRKRIA